MTTRIEIELEIKDEDYTRPAVFEVELEEGFNGPTWYVVGSYWHDTREPLPNAVVLANIDRVEAAVLDAMYDM